MGGLVKWEVHVHSTYIYFVILALHWSSKHYLSLRTGFRVIVRVKQLPPTGEKYSGYL